MKTLNEYTLSNAHSCLLDAERIIEKLEAQPFEAVKDGAISEALKEIKQSRIRLANIITINAEGEAWKRYKNDMENHNFIYDARKPKREDYASDKAWHTAFNQWSMDEAMSRPNKPGYHRANND